EERGRDGQRTSDHGEGGGCVPELIRLPCERDEEDPVTEERPRHAGPEQAEARMAQRCQKAKRCRGEIHLALWPRYPRRPIEGLVAMQHAIPAARRRDRDPSPLP